MNYLSSSHIHVVDKDELETNLRSTLPHKLYSRSISLCLSTPKTKKKKQKVEVDYDDDTDPGIDGIVRQFHKDQNRRCLPSDGHQHSAFESTLSPTASVIYRKRRTHTPISNTRSNGMSTRFIILSGKLFS